jgi:hypothetical protein
VRSLGIVAQQFQKFAAFVETEWATEMCAAMVDFHVAIEIIFDRFQPADKPSRSVKHQQYARPPYEIRLFISLLNHFFASTWYGV